MLLVEWTDELSVGVVGLDRQHRNNIDLMNRLYEACQAKGSDDPIPEAVETMVEYTATHFSAEERIFDTIGYPYTENHKKEHRAFINKVERLSEKLSGGEDVSAVEITTFLRNWLVHHIQQVDKKCVPFFKEHGSK